MTRRSVCAKIEDERRFPVRVRIMVPAAGFGRQLDAMHAWLNERVGQANYAVHSDREIGYGDTCLWYFLDATIAHAFIDQFGCGLLVIERR